MAGVRGRSGGRNARTVKEHLLKGTFQKVRHGGVKNPEPPDGIPTPPKKLAGDTKEEWGRMLERLSSSKTLSTVDGGALYQYSCLFGETEKIAQRMEHNDSLIDGIEDRLHELHDGDYVSAIQQLTELKKLESRYINQIRQGRMALRAYLVEFGLTPASRGRVKIADKPQTDPFSEFDGETVQ